MYLQFESLENSGTIFLKSTPFFPLHALSRNFAQQPLAMHEFLMHFSRLFCQSSVRRLLAKCNGSITFFLPIYLISFLSAAVFNELQIWMFRSLTGDLHRDDFGKYGRQAGAVKCLFMRSALDHFGCQFLFHVTINKIWTRLLLLHVGFRIDLRREFAERR